MDIEFTAREIELSVARLTPLPQRASKTLRRSNRSCSLDIAIPDSDRLRRRRGRRTFLTMANSGGEKKSAASGENIFDARLWRKNVHLFI